MKILSTKIMNSYQQSVFKGTNDNNKSNPNIIFKGNPTKPSPLTDKILKNKLVGGLFKLADKNPFAFNIVALATACMALRPATVMVVPGSNDKDKKYAAGKSFIASFISTASRLLFILPLGIAIKKLAEKAKIDPKIHFPADGTDAFKKFNFAINNASGAIIAIPTAALVVYLVAKIMDILMKEPKNENKSFGLSNNQAHLDSKKIEKTQEVKNS